MSWMENRLAPVRRAVVALLAVGAMAGVLLAPPALATTIVVRSNGPSAGVYPVGRTLPAGAAITLRAGDVVTVLDAGGTRVLRGPGKVSVTGTGPATANGIAALIADTGTRQSRTGATRGSNTASPHPTSVWSLDIAGSGNFCVANVKTLALWRAHGDAATTVTIMPDGGPDVPVAFRSGQAVAAWPAGGVPISDGSRFRIAGAALTSASPMITLRVLPTMPDSLDAAAQALLDHGCMAQIDTLIAATTAEAGS